ncbi:hypothetical protein FEF26_11485 [Nesterenkonia salmonea]|uniref:Asparagine synthetase domain-containing protein n=1 Tax=Nesterenkonia salmonea TaxID=1804987 RepID=A0A5R9B906_9MICC|nr:hypothetical protein [Nesterenkonia salmonea]TLP94739.1 hypothetical protein FEF26_11485 [Nesterenkonia salmonea]
MSNLFYLDNRSAIQVHGSFLYGYAYTDRAVIFGSKGLRDYLRENPENLLPDEGRFAAIFVDNDELTIKVDSTGQELLYLYQAGEDWAISNSFMHLVHRVSASRKLSFYEPAAMNFHLKDGKHIGEQLISHRTMVKQIKTVPLGHEVRVSRSTGRLNVKKLPFLHKYGDLASDGYSDLLKRFLDRSSGLLQAIAAHGYEFNLSLSGGYDSRLVLALLIQSGAAPNVRISSLTSKPNDFKVAKSLCDRFRLPLNQPRGTSSPRNMSSSDSIRMYLESCGGTYLPFYPVMRNRLNPQGEFHLTGDQPSGLSFLAGRAKFNGEVPKIAEDIRLALSQRVHGEQVREDFLSTFSDLGVASEDPVAPLVFYSAIRARHHGGRSWYKSLGDSALLTPLMHSDLIRLDVHNVRAGHRQASSGYGSKQKFFADVFSAIGGWPLEEPFETDNRQFPTALLDESPFRGGVRIEPSDFEVYGHLGDIEADPSDKTVPPLDLDLWDGPDRIRHDLGILLKRTRQRDGNLFSADDLATARDQVESAGNLSHEARKLCHVVSVDVVQAATID